MYDNEKDFRKNFIKRVINNPNLVPLFNVYGLKKLVLTKEVPYFAIDDDHIYINPDAYKTLNDREFEYILLHEFSHILFEHINRFFKSGTYVKKYINPATDLAINSLLGYPVPRKGWSPKNQNFPEHLSAESYYQLLVKKYPNMPEPPQLPPPQQPPGDFPTPPPQPPQQPKKKGDVPTPSKDKDNKQPDLLDNHDFYKDKKFNEIKNELVQNIDNLKKEIDELVGKGVGEDYFTILGKELQNYKLREMILNNFLLSIKKNRIPSWKRLEVRRGFYQPGRVYEREPLIALVVDTSGSMYNSVLEMKKIIATIKAFGFQTKLYSFDVDFVDYGFFEDPKLIDKVKFKGGGGTDINPILHYLNKKLYECDGIIIFTDGYFDKITAPLPKFPTIWVLPKDANTIKYLPPKAIYFFI